MCAHPHMYRSEVDIGVFEKAFKNNQFCRKLLGSLSRDFDLVVLEWGPGMCIGGKNLRNLNSDLNITAGSCLLSNQSLTLSLVPPPHAYHVHHAWFFRWGECLLNWCYINDTQM